MYAFSGWLNHQAPGHMLSPEQSLHAIKIVRNMLFKTVLLTRPWYQNMLTFAPEVGTIHHATDHPNGGAEPIDPKSLVTRRLDDERWLIFLPQPSEKSGEERLAIAIIQSGPFTLGMLFPFFSPDDAWHPTSSSEALRFPTGDVFSLVKHYAWPLPSHSGTVRSKEQDQRLLNTRHTVWLGHIPEEEANFGRSGATPWPYVPSLPPHLERALSQRSTQHDWQKLGSNYSLTHWDGKEQMLLLARNPLGFRPLWLSDLPNGLLFSTDLTAFLGHPDFIPRLNKTSLAELFVIGPNKTPGYGVYSNVYALLPGHLLIVHKGSSKKHMQPFFQLTAAAPPSGYPEDTERALEEAKEKLLAYFDAALHAIHRPGRTYAALLSGGLDSSAIVARTQQLFPDAPPLLTFSLDYEDNARFFTANRLQPEEDSTYIEAMVRAYQTEHTHVIIHVDELLGALERAMWVRGTPGMVDIDSALLLLSERLRQTLGARTNEVFSGEGADELLGGYPWYWEPYHPLEAHTFPWYRHMDRRLSVLTRDAEHLLTPEAYARLRLEQALKEVPAPWEDDRLDADKRALTYLNLTRWASVLLERKDTMTRLSGLAFHLPFIDLELVQYAWALPWALKAWQHEAKGLFRYALSGFLPEAVRRRKKSPFPKTYHPAFIAGIQKAAEPLLDDPHAPLWQWIEREQFHASVRDLPTAAPLPWFGQLLGAPQWIYYLISIHHWLKTVQPIYEGP